jgi:hypothetical protein
MLADDDINIAFDPPDADRVYASHLETCRRAGAKPILRERAQGLIAEWNEVPSGRPEPTQQ